MVHSYLNWTYHGSDYIYIQSFAVKYAVWFPNLLPNHRSGITLIELLTINKANHCDQSRSHIWGFPVFVLDPKLQNYQNIPKWHWRSILGQLLGFSEQHSSLIANVHKLKTGHISPQYHVFFDNFFETVYITGEMVLKLMQFGTTYLITNKIGKFCMNMLNRGSYSINLLLFMRYGSQRLIVKSEKKNFPGRDSIIGTQIESRFIRYLI